MSNHARMSEVSRRTALKAIATTAALPALSPDGLAAYARIQTGQPAPSPRLLSPREFETLELLVEAIIPTDERSPGAREARVADYIDLLLSESEHDVALQWIGGLAALDREAVTRFGAPFVQLTAEQVDGILADVSRNERQPATALELFFVMTKQATVRGYYSSEIGIHRELRYKGNQYLQTFVGCATEDGQSCPHCGQEP